MKITVRTKEDCKEINSSINISILTLLHEHDIYISAPCGGKGTCGKCKIKVLKGTLPVSSKDEQVFSNEELNKGCRLACSAFPTEDLEIMIESSEEGFDVLTAYQRSNESVECSIQTVEVYVNDVNWQEIKSIHQALELKFSKSLEFSYKGLKNLSKAFHEFMKSSGTTKTVTLLFDEEKVIDAFYKKDIEVYGIAIDIGTTTLGFHLVDLQTGKIMAVHTGLNNQRTYGADVITRIQSASTGNLVKLNRMIITDIVTGIEKLLEDTGIDKRFVYKISIAGNTTMIHLLLGLPPESLGQFPFTATTLKLVEYPFQNLFGSQLLDCEVSLLPAVDAYVGADIAAGILHHGMFNTEKVSMLIDIGTNGEIVIGNRHSILATAAAAGPALEGGNISCGVGCVNGAIISVKYQDGTFDCKIMGNQKPIGICGSGIIDVISEGLKHGWIDDTGRLSEEFAQGDVTIFNENEALIKISQKDIREVQLAKSAIRAGIECLIKEYGIRYDEIENVYLAGGFGSSISIENSVVIGLIPKELKHKIIVSGNSSLGGAVKYLLDKNAKSSLEKIIHEAKAINLSTNPDFNNLFVENMYFKIEEK